MFPKGIVGGINQKFGCIMVRRKISLCRSGKGREMYVAEVRVGKNESLDTALKRFKRSCAKDGVIAEVRKREHYEKPSVKRKKKSEAARKRKY